MFERYTEKARRVIFFARYEASQFGSPYIESEHLLLGILREDKALTNRFLRSQGSVESIRHQIEGHTVIGEKSSTSVDLPLSNDGKRVLAYAAEEAERLAHKHIGTEHLLLGLLRADKSFAAQILAERGVLIAEVRKDLAAGGHESAQRQSPPANPIPVPPPPAPVLPVRFVDAASSETLFAYNSPSPGWRFPAIGETIDFRTPGTPSASGSIFRVENVSWIYLLEPALPEEVVALEKRLEFIVQREENAIANHEFEKARFYSDEQQKMRATMRILREKYLLDQPAPEETPNASTTPALQEVVITIKPA